MVAAKKQQTTESTKFFQGVGLIYGRVTQYDEQKMTVEIEGQKFKLTCFKSLLKKLISTLETNAESFLYLRVYPQFNIYTQQLGFHVVGFFTSQPKQSMVNQFLLAGVWQYIPQLPDQPVMTIYRNELRPWESPYKFRINHVPVVGFAEQPYFHKPKNPKSATPRKFYELVVSFIPQQQEFQFVLVLDSTEKIPTYVKRKFKQQKPASDSLAVKVKRMNFSVLQKTAAKLRESGFFEGKIAGKGVTKEALTARIQDTLANHPEAVKALD